MSLSVQLRKELSRLKESRYRIAEDSGVPYAVLGRFIDGKRDIRLKTADKLFKYLNLELTKKQPSKGKKLKGSSISTQLYSYLSKFPESRYKISKNSEVAHATLRRFLNKEQDILLRTADRLAGYLKLQLKKK